MKQIGAPELWHKSFIPDPVPLLTGINILYVLLSFPQEMQVHSTIILYIILPRKFSGEEENKIHSLLPKHTTWFLRGIIKSYLPQIFSLLVWFQSTPLKITHKLSNQDRTFFSRDSLIPVWEERQYCWFLLYQHFGKTKFSRLVVVALEAWKKFLRCDELWKQLISVKVREARQGLTTRWLKYRADQEGSQGVNTDLKGSKETHHTKQGRIPTFCLGPIYYLVLFLALTHSFYLE